MKATYCASVILTIAVFTCGMATVSDQVLPSIENGDYNGDGSRNITDAINMFRYLFTGDATPPDPVEASCLVSGSPSGSGAEFAPTLVNGDVNGDGSFNLADGVHFLRWLFNGGAEPVTIECHAIEK